MSLYICIPRITILFRDKDEHDFMKQFSHPLFLTLTSGTKMTSPPPGGGAEMVPGLQTHPTDTKTGPHLNKPTVQKSTR